MPVTTPALVGICLGTTLFLVTVAAVTCFCYRRHTRLTGGKKRSPDKPLTLHPHRRPTAVKSPPGAAGSHYLKKSPSPTNPARTPPGPGGSGTPSPSVGHLSPQPPSSSPMTDTQPITIDNKDITFHMENEVKDKPSTPTKDEIETNEKNLAANETVPGKLGQLVFKLRYKSDKNALLVTVVKCKELPAKDPNLGSSDPYVKLQLLPDKQHKVKTRVLRKTRNPSITLHFVVLSFDRYSRDDIIGEVFCALNTVDLSQAENYQLTLCREINPRSLKVLYLCYVQLVTTRELPADPLVLYFQIRAQGRGEILVSLCWQPAANRLTVVVLKARNLPKMDVTGLADPYVKMYLLYNSQRIAKKKTHVKKRTLNPVFNESFVFDIPAGAEGLDNVSLEFLLLDWDRVTKNEVIGRLELGSSKSTGSALHHWNEVCNSPRRQIAEWHKLRE
uniref:C2 domain-containing protein n=1 Tax=Timema shepardi TaxID=629360 RepID=A0A7R9ARJ1_TIMSH|nr:unnamed protein product [Timema shepardi]